jgi:hypothetical protein
VANARPGQLDDKIADLYLADKFPAEEKSTDNPKEDPAQFVGTYRNPESHSLLEVSAKDGELLIYGQHLKSHGKGRFTFDFGGEAQFQSPATTPPRFTLAFPDSPAEHYEKVEPPLLTEATLASYVGDFTSQELEVTYRLAMKDGKLTVAMNWREPATVSPSFTDEFQGPDGTALVFRRDKAHHITSLDLHAGRVRNITFNKVPK